MLVQKSVASHFAAAVGFILVVAAGAKLWSVVHSEVLWRARDPLLPATIAVVWISSAVIDLFVVWRFCRRPDSSSLVGIAWLATLLALYRIGLWWIGWKKPCSCLGNLTDTLHISPQLADNVMKGLLAFMFLGSVALLILDHRCRRVRGNPPPESAHRRLAS